MTNKEERNKKHQEAMNRLFQSKEKVGIELQNKREILEQLRENSSYTTRKEKEIVDVMDSLGDTIDFVWVEEFCLKIKNYSSAMLHKKVKNLLALKATIDNLNGKKNELKDNIKILQDER